MASKFSISAGLDQIIVNLVRYVGCRFTQIMGEDGHFWTEELDLGIHTKMHTTTPYQDMICIKCESSYEPIVRVWSLRGVICRGRKQGSIRCSGKPLFRKRFYCPHCGNRIGQHDYALDSYPIRQRDGVVLDVEEDAEPIKEISK
jgi:hypothetical protein